MKNVLEVDTVKPDPSIKRAGFLLKNWHDDKSAVRASSLPQIVSSAGDGRIENGSDGSRIFREFLSRVEVEDLTRFVAECLVPDRKGRRKNAGGYESGFVLQDIVNEIGRRLDFEVENGNYRGREGLVGFDGLWRDGDGDIVVEVKTTDIFSISLDHVNGYREKLIAENRIGASSAVLFIVGRNETGALEAQIRGSRHAWTMRMVGIESLLRLLQIKVHADAPIVSQHIKSLLRPVEYTRVDGIVDLVFGVKVDAEEPTPSADELEGVATLTPADQHRTVHATALPIPTIELFRRDVANAVSNHLDAQLIRLKRSSFEDQQAGIRAVIAVSKRYERGYQSYWFAFYDSQRRYLQGVDKAFLVLSALDTGRVWIVPAEVIEPLLPQMKTTVRPDGQVYWHIIVQDNLVERVLVVGKQKVPLDSYETTGPVRP